MGAANICKHGNKWDKVGELMQRRRHEGKERWKRTLWKLLHFVRHVCISNLFFWGGGGVNCTPFCFGQHTNIFVIQYLIK